MARLRAISIKRNCPPAAQQRAHKEWNRAGDGKNEQDVQEALDLTVAALAAQQSAAQQSGVLSLSRRPAA